MGSFSRDITKFCEKTKLKINVVVRKLALQGLAGVVQKTPVLTGRLRGSWRVSIGGANTLSVVGRNSAKETTDPTGVATIAAGSNVINNSPLEGDIAIYITNNLPYAQRIEDGYSKVKAPQGMLKVTFEQIKLDFEKTVASVEAAEVVK